MTKRFTVNFSLVMQSHSAETEDFEIDDLSEIPELTRSYLSEASITNDELNAVAIYISRNGTTGFTSDDEAQA